MRCSNGDVVDKTETRWRILAAVVTRWPDGNEGALRVTLHNMINSLANGTKGTLNGIQ